MSTVDIPLGASIQAAINANPAGTVFQLAAGTYRGEQFQAKANDQFIGDPGGGTILSGAIVLNNWTASGGYFVATGLPAPLTGMAIAGSNPLSSDLNDLFINNQLYTRVSSLAQVTAGKWYFDTSTNSAYISDNPAGKTVEYSVTPSMTYGASGVTGVVVQNLTIEKYATDAQTAPIQAVAGWQINNVTSTENHGTGLNIGAGTIVQGGHYVDNGQLGIGGGLANGAEVLDAEIAYNNYAGYNIDWEAGGLKIAASSGVVISGNDVHDNVGHGIWGDVDDSNWTVSGNTITANTGAGIMYEISHGQTVISDNVISASGRSGILLSNSDGVAVYGNTVTVGVGNNDISGGIDVYNGVRGSGPYGVYQSVNDAVYDNTIIHQNDTALDGEFLDNPVTLSGGANDTFDANTYYVSNGAGIYWEFGGVDYTWSGLHKSTPFEASGTEIAGTPAKTTSSSSTGTTSAGTTSSGTTSSGTTAASTGLVLSLSEDAWQGDAEFTVSVDGVQVGGVMTVTASHAAGQSQAFAISTTLGAGSHSVAVSFINDAYGGTTSTDRNLYLNGATFNGQAVAGASATLMSNGTASFSVIPAAAPTSETLVLDLSEDAWQGNAQFTVSVDGVQVGGVLTATASHAAGQTQAYTISTTLAAGSHSVAVSFINDAYGGTASTDRNLYLDGASINGQAIVGASATLLSNGTATVNVSNNPQPPASTLVLTMSEDAWQGDAEFMVTVDGHQYGGVYTATASHAAGQSQAFTIANIPESFAAHDIAVSFINDAYGGTASTDRNLYVNSLQFDNQPVPNGSATLLSNGTQHFAASAPANWAG